MKPKSQPMSGRQVRIERNPNVHPMGRVAEMVGEAAFLAFSRTPPAFHRQEDVAALPAPMEVVAHGIEGVIRRPLIRIRLVGGVRKTHPKLQCDRLSVWEFQAHGDGRFLFERNETVAVRVFDSISGACDYRGFREEIGEAGERDLVTARAGMPCVGERDRVTLPSVLNLQFQRGG